MADRYAGLRQRMTDDRLRARAYTREHGADSPEVLAWVLPDVGETERGGPSAMSDTGDDND